jgi:prefoldin subunit 1
MAEQQMIEQLWELQTRQTELRRHLVQLTNQLSSAAKERDVIDVTIREMEQLPRDTRTYRVVGKMFVVTEPADLRAELLDIKGESERRDEGRLALRDQFVARLKDTEAQADMLASNMQRSPLFRPSH